MTDQKIRLHVAPFSQDLLSAVLPSTIAHLADNISYHTLQTFPENNYGYLELPSMEAEKLKKKLNGSILKGRKIRIEEARPRKRVLEENKESAHTAASAESVRRPKRAKHDPATVSGHELSPDRKVKRGWTEPKKAKVRKTTRGHSDQASSKYSDKEEVLFRTKLPPNKSKAANRHPKKDARNPRNILVHEFEKSTIQPSFLREESASDIKKAVEYVDGKGWIDEDGEVVEEEPSRLRKKKRSSQPKAEAEKALLRTAQELPDARADLDDETSSAGSSTDSESTMTPSLSLPDGSKATSLEESEAQNTPTPSVHPLEEIFKRPTKAASVDIAKPSLEVQTSFSFFEPDQEITTAIPDTPFNSQELRSRQLRSAAPTPDTAAPSRFNSWGSRGRSDIESEDDDEEETIAQAAAAAVTPSKVASSEDKGGQESDFVKFFWENRGDNNRAWKRRAREAKKEKRQRENRQRSRRL